MNIFFVFVLEFILISMYIFRKGITEYRGLWPNFLKVFRKGNSNNDINNVIIIRSVRMNNVWMGCHQH